MFPGNSVRNDSVRNDSVRNDSVRNDSVRDDSQQVRDIQNLIAQLDDVNKKLALPVRAMPMAHARDAEPADAPSV